MNKSSSDAAALLDTLAWVNRVLLGVTKALSSSAKLKAAAKAQIKASQRKLHPKKLTTAQKNLRKKRLKSLKELAMLSQEIGLYDESRSGFDSFKCEHANEAPAQCDCESDCYCKRNMCRRRRIDYDGQGDQ